MGTRPATTLAKGLRLLGAISTDQGRRNLSEIAATLGLPLPTAHRLALTLVEEGFLHRVSKGYFVAQSLGNSSSETNLAVTERAERYRGALFRLARKFAAITHFGVLEEGMVTYLIKECAADTGLFTAENMQLEAYCTGVGKILLAAMTEAELDGYLANGPFVTLTDRTLTDPAQIRQEIDQVRMKWVAYDRCEIREDLFCIAVPVRKADGSIIGALSLSLVSRLPDAAEQRQIIRDLRRIATANQA